LGHDPTESMMMVVLVVIIIYVLGVVPLGLTVRWPVHIAATAAAATTTVVAIVAFSFRGIHRLLMMFVMVVNAMVMVCGGVAW